MSNQEPTRSDIVAALGVPTFVLAASRLSGSALRGLISERLHAAGIDVVVVAANAIGSVQPYPGAELVWQPQSGGDFRRHLVSWTIGQPAVMTHEPSGVVHVAADCARCGQHNELTLDQDVTSTGFPCSRCGSSLI